jgi:hypothetical protein
MQALPAGGAMVSIGALESAVGAALAAYPATVSVAAVNGPASVVISGVEADVMTIAAGFARQGIHTKRLAVSHAFHSPLMEPALKAFANVAESVEYRSATMPVISNVTGKVAGAELGTPEYWVDHVRQPVRFYDGIRVLHDLGVRRYVEQGPSAVLVGLVPECVPAEDAVMLGASLRAERPEAECVLEALGGYYTDGGQVEWRGVFPGAGLCVELPTYPWQRQRYWVGDMTISPRPVADHRQTTPNDVLRALHELVHLPAGVSPDLRLIELGIDSLGIASLRSTIARFPSGRAFARTLGPASQLSEVFKFIDSMSSDETADVYEVAALVEGAQWIEVTAQSLNKRNPENVFLCRCARVLVAGRPAVIGELRMNSKHSFFYERELDHVPGMYIIEGTRQLGNWWKFVSEGRLESGATLDRVDADFYEFVEHDQPAYIVLTASQDGGAVGYVSQARRTKAVVSIAGRRIASREYQQIRARQRDHGSAE